MAYVLSILPSSYRFKRLKTSSSLVNDRTVVQDNCPLQSNGEGGIRPLSRWTCTCDPQQADPWTSIINSLSSDSYEQQALLLATCNCLKPSRKLCVCLRACVRVCVCEYPIYYLDLFSKVGIDSKHSLADKNMQISCFALLLLSCTTVVGQETL